MNRTSAIMALIAAAATTLIKLRLAEDLWWPFRVGDYLAALLLAAGAIAALRGGRGRLLAAGWAVTLGLTWSSFFHHLAERPSLAQMTPVAFGLGLLLLAAIVGVALCIASRRGEPGNLGAIS